MTGIHQLEVEIVGITESYKAVKATAYPAGKETSEEVRPAECDEEMEEDVRWNIQRWMEARTDSQSGCLGSIDDVGSSPST